MARTDERDQQASGRGAVAPWDEVLPPAQAGHLRVPARAGLLRRRRHRAHPAGQLHQADPEQLAYLINADLFTCGIASIIQSVGFWKIGVRMPLLQGVTFAAVSPMISIGLAEGGGVPGLRAIYGAVIVAGVFAFLVAPFFARLIRLFPPVVTGTVITIIGIVLLSVAALDVGGGGASMFTNPPTFGALRNLALAGFTLLVILCIYRLFSGFVATIAVLIGLLVGTLAGWIFDFTDFAGSAAPTCSGSPPPSTSAPPPSRRPRSSRWSS